MVRVIEALFDAAFRVWDNCIGGAFESFKTSPRTSNGYLWNTVLSIFETVKMGAIPLATLFFIIAIYKSVVASPPEQALKKFLTDAIKYVVILFVIDKLAMIIEGIMLFSERFSDILISAGLGSTPDKITDLPEVSTLMDNIHNLRMDLSTVEVMDFGATIETFFEQMGPFLLYFMAGIITIIVLISSGLSVIGIAYQRIVKPLIMIPFSTVILSMSCCSDEGTKSMWSMGKTFLGLCISGGFFVLAVRMGTIVSSSLMDGLAEGGGSEVSSAILVIVRVNTGALITTGLLKSMDAMVQKSFG